MITPFILVIISATALASLLLIHQQYRFFMQYRRIQRRLDRHTRSH